MADPKSRNPLTSALLNILQSGKNSDLNIACGGVRWRVHQAIVCSRSEYFDKAVNGGFEEGHTGVIKLNEEEPDLVERMLLYLYTLEYPTSIDVEKRIGFGDFFHSSSDPPMVVHAKMYALADKYQLDQELKDLCKISFKVEAEIHWGEESFAEACVLSFNMTPESDRGLRDIVVEVLHGHAYTIMGCKPFKDRLRDMGTLAIEVLMHVMEDGGTPEKRYCCGMFYEKNWGTTVCCHDCLKALT